MVLAGAVGVTAVATPAVADDEPEATVPAVVVEASGEVAAVDVPAGDLDELRRRPGVDAVVTRGRSVSAEMAQSVAKVGAPALWAEGYSGAGRVIVVIDTGVASTFGGTLVGQACFAASLVGPNLVGHCGPSSDVTEAFDQTCFDLGICDVGDPNDVLDPDAGRPCSPQRECRHGTAVAAVAARHTAPQGVAPDAGVYAIRVFNPSGTQADLVDLLLALDHARRLYDAGLDVAAVNLSVATSITFAGACDSDPFLDAPSFRQLFDQLKARGIATVVASGNDGKVGSIAFPACVSSSVAVGATDLDDDLADFGNRASTIDLVAPGADEGNGDINPMEIPDGANLWAGTSFSAPHVAGAFALLTTQLPKASVDQLVGLLRDTGVRVTDPYTGTPYRRLDLAHIDAGLAVDRLFRGSAGVTGTARSALGDLDGDGRADVVAHGPGPGGGAISYGRTTWGFDRRSATVGGDPVPLVGQLRGAASSPDDILWYGPGGAADALWVGHPSRTPQSAPVAVSGVYSPVVGDFDGDGWDDILWYAPGGSADPIWFGGPSEFTKGVTSIKGTYAVRVGDFDGDARDDVLLYAAGSSHSVWFGTAARSFAKTTLTAVGGRRVGVGRLNGDNRDDVLLHGPGASTDRLLLGTGSRSFTTVAMTVSGSYIPVVADIDRDGLDDVLWYAPGPSPDPVWFALGDGTPAQRGTASVSGTYAPLVGDLDGDGWDDLVWANTAAALTPVWWSYVPPGG